MGWGASPPNLARLGRITKDWEVHIVREPWIILYCVPTTLYVLALKAVGSRQYFHGDNVPHTSSVLVL